MIKGPSPLLWHSNHLHFEIQILPRPIAKSIGCHRNSSSFVAQKRKKRTLFSGTNYCDSTRMMQMLKSSHPKLADQLFFKYILCSKVCQITSLASHSWARLPLEHNPDLKHFRHHWNETSGVTSQWDYAVIQLLIHTQVTQTSANQISTTCGEMWIFTLPLLEAT